MKPVPGIHHVTAIAGHPGPNHQFYTQVLGLRLVKKTVNFDDPGTYHLYYGNRQGSPGTILTHFPWPGIQQGRRGTGQATEIQFRVPPGALDYWLARFQEHNVTYNNPAERMGEQYLVALDPDGLKLELVTTAQGPEYAPYAGGPVPEQYALRGFQGVTLTLEGYEATARILTDALGYTFELQDNNRYRFRAPNGDVVDLVCVPGERHGWVAGGTVHHVAFRAEDDAHEMEIREKLLSMGMNVTPQLDRNYFHSVYFREPGHVLFEIATDPPGFDVDEPVDQLGQALKLPDWMEPRRAEIEGVLPPLTSGPETATA